MPARAPSPRDLPPALPRRGNAATRALGRLALRLLGWRLEGTFPDLSKFVLVGYPHTSNWDGIVGLAAAVAYGVEVHFFVKREIMRGPLGGLLRLLGGIPVDRSLPGGLVGRAVEEFARRDAFLLGVTPEGTRGRVERWKTGFHAIARAAGVPFVVVALDFGRKVIGPGAVVEPTGDLARDLRALYAHFEGVQGKNPALASPPSPQQLGGEAGRPGDRP